MIRLYYSPHTRSSRPRWILEELGVPYDLHRLDFMKGEHKSPDYLKIHPLGKVPAMRDGDKFIFESAAIVAYLADKYPEKKLAPLPSAPERAEYYQWLFFSAGAFDDAIVNYFYHTKLYAEDKRVPSIAEASKATVAQMAKVLEKTLKDRSFILGKEFSAADIILASLVKFADRMKLLEDFPTLRSYGKRMGERPAFQRATAD
jgi:glutathione S-transferase